MRVAAACAAFLILWAPIDSAARKRKRRTPRRTELNVTPSVDIDARVRQEIDRAEAILEAPSAANLFDSSYLISSIYYRDGFLSQYPENRADGDPARRIISHLSRLLTPQRKDAVIRLLHETYDERLPGSGAPLLAPVRYAASARIRRLRRTHPHAIDLFAAEGSLVRSVSQGVALLAENGWTEADPFSTSSHSGGNTIIVFDPATDRFYRYCHLAAVSVPAGAIVEAGQEIGTIGHTGLNASRNGHGRHLHFEINQYEGEVIRPLTYQEIWDLLPE